MRRLRRLLRRLLRWLRRRPRPRHGLFRGLFSCFGARGCGLFGRHHRAYDDCTFVADSGCYGGSYGDYSPAVFGSSVPIYETPMSTGQGGAVYSSPAPATEAPATPAPEKPATAPAAPAAPNPEETSAPTPPPPSPVPPPSVAPVPTPAVPAHAGPGRSRPFRFRDGQAEDLNLNLCPSPSPRSGPSRVAERFVPAIESDRIARVLGALPAPNRFSLVRQHPSLPTLRPPEAPWPPAVFLQRSDNGLETGRKTYSTSRFRRKCLRETMRHNIWGRSLYGNSKKR